MARVTRDPETLANPRLWLAFASMLFVSGITNVFPVFFPALLAEFGGSRGATAFTVSLCWPPPRARAHGEHGREPPRARTYGGCRP